MHDAASGHLGRGSILWNGPVVGGEWHVYPEQAAAGLWTTPSDLARFLIAVQKAHAGEPDAILNHKLARDMLTPQKNSQAGLGLFLSNADDDGTFDHGGANKGFRCRLLAGKKNGNGIVVMTNSDNGSAMIDQAIRLVSQCFKLGL